MRGSTYRHLSSTTLIMGRIPFCASFGGAAAREPSPRNTGPSSVLTSWAASRMVKGRTRTATVIDEAPSSTAMMMQDGDDRKGAHATEDGAERECLQMERSGINGSNRGLLDVEVWCSGGDDDLLLNRPNPVSGCRVGL